MQAEINFKFDLGTAAGRAEFQRLFGHMLVPTVTPRQDHGPILSDDGSNIAAGPDPEPEPPEDEPVPAPRRMPPPNLTSIPDDPVRAAAAKAGRQEAAAKARAAKAAKAEAAGLLGGTVETIDGLALKGSYGNGAEDNGQDQDQAVEEDLGLVDPNMSPAEAKEAGLAIVREAYAAGKVAQVKALQKAWGIAKFYDIPNEKGHEFFAQVMKLAHETGLRK